MQLFLNVKNLMAKHMELHCPYLCRNAKRISQVQFYHIIRLIKVSCDVIFYNNYGSCNAVKTNTRNFSWDCCYLVLESSASLKSLLNLDGNTPSSVKPSITEAPCCQPLREIFIQLLDLCITPGCF